MQKNHKDFSIIAVKFLIAFFVVLPVLTIAQPNNHTIKVMTYNIHHGNPPDKPGVIELDRIAAVIKEQQPDIVALQEVDVDTKRDGNINEIALIAAKSGYKSYYFAKTIDLEGGQYGIAILSKYPLSDTITHKLPAIDTLKGEPRVLATALVHLPDGKLIQFGSTHLDAYHEQNRLLQIEEINRLAGQSQYPFVIGGDFNAKESSDVIKLLDQAFIRTCNACQPTFNEPDIDDEAIDFLAFKPVTGFNVISHRVLKSERSSDHFPVVAVLRFKQ